MTDWLDSLKPLDRRKRFPKMDALHDLHTRLQGAVQNGDWSQARTYLKATAKLLGDIEAKLPR